MAPGGNARSRGRKGFGGLVWSEMGVGGVRKLAKPPRLSSVYGRKYVWTMLQIDTGPCWMTSTVQTMQCRRMCAV